MSSNIFPATAPLSPLTIGFYAAAAVLLTVGLLLLAKSSASRKLSPSQKRKTQTGGILTIVVAAIALGNGLITQSYSTAGSHDSHAPPKTAANSAGTSHPGSSTALVQTPAQAVSGARNIFERYPFEPPAPKPPPPELQQAQNLLEQNQTDQAVQALNAYLAKNPEDLDAYALLAQAHIGKSQWDLAEKDFDNALLINPSSAKLKFDLAELDFVQDKYDAARVKFSALTNDPACGDVAAYKVYLCDLYGGHEDAAANELNALNGKEENASYYFANAAACLYYGRNDEAKTWLTSADHIYPFGKFHLYADSLVGRKTARDAAGNLSSDSH